MEKEKLLKSFNLIKYIHICLWFNQICTLEMK
jgi:hypothetical protein